MTKKIDAEKTIEMTREALETVNENLKKSMEEYVKMGTDVQDEIFALAHEQMDGYRKLTTQALEQQKQFFSQFEKNAKRSRELWLKGLENWQNVLKPFPKA